MNWSIVVCCHYTGIKALLCSESTYSPWIDWFRNAHGKLNNINWKKVKWNLIYFIHKLINDCSQQGISDLRIIFPCRWWAKVRGEGHLTDVTVPFTIGGNLCASLLLCILMWPLWLFEWRYVHKEEDRVFSPYVS